MADQISTWKYKTSSQTKWAYEVRFPTACKKIQKRGFASRAEALNEAKRMRLQEKKVQLRAPISPSVSEVCADYLVHLIGAIREHSRSNYRAILHGYLLPALGSKKICDVTEGDITRLLLSLRNRGLLNGTVNTVRTRIIGLFNYAFRNGIVERNVAALTRVQRMDSNTETRVCSALSAAEATLLLKASEGTNLDTFMALTLALGLRKGEALALRWSDFDFENGYVTIQRTRGQNRYLDDSGTMRSLETEGPTKTKSSCRTLPLNAVVLAALHRQSQAMGGDASKHVVSAHEGRPMALATLHRAYKRLIEKAQIRYVRIHDLRHSAACIALESKAPLEAVSQSLGHSTVEITKRIYAPKVAYLDEVFSRTLGEALKPLSVEDFGEASSPAGESNLPFSQGKEA